MSTETSDTSALRASLAKGYGGPEDEALASSPRRPTSIPTELLHPPVPLAQQIKAVFTLRVLGGLVLVASFVLVCTIMEGDEKLFMSKVARPGLSSLEDCRTLCRNHRRGVPLSCNENDGHVEWRLKFTNNGFPRTMCTYMVEPAKWQPFLVVGLLAFSIALIIDGAPSEIVLLGADVVLVAMGVLTESEAYGTLSNKSIIALALLFPIAAAVDDTGALEIVLGKVLGNPQNLTQAIMRLMVVVSVLSAFLANTAVVAAMLPGIIAWSRRINLSPSLMLMPLSFGAQLGGATTLIGSSACLVARDATLDFYGGEGMAMFDLTPIGVILAVVVGFACIAFSPLLPQPPAAPRAGDEEAAAGGGLYRVGFIIQAHGALAGGGLEETGIERVAGVAAVTRQASEGEPLGPSEELTVMCTAEGIAALRQVRGMVLLNSQEIERLGEHRRRRRLFEVTFHATAPLLQRSVTAAHVRRVYGACVLALRRPGHHESLSWRHAGKEELRAGDIVVFEADKSYVGSLAWSENFSLVREVPNSAPPRNSNASDKARSVFVCLGLLVLIVLVALPKPYNYVSLDYGAGILLLLLLVTKSVSPQDMYTSMKPGVLLTIAGAMGLGMALENTGVANLLARRVAGVAKLGGAPGIFAAVYMVACGLSMFINNSATIAMVAPMLPTMAEQTAQPIPVKFLVLTLVFGAGSCFTTPLGYQTNMMVMADGGYRFSDFMKFGGPVQAVHCLCCIFLCCGCALMSS